MTSIESQTQIKAFIDALGIERPVLWGLPETDEARLNFRPAEFTQNADGSPAIETDVESYKEMAIGLFIPPNELGESRNENGKLRHESNVIRFTSVFVDMDSGKPEQQIERLKKFHLPPSIVVRTGRGHHAYWILDRFEEVEPERWRSVQKAMAGILQGDKAAVDPARLMRLPGTWHVKYEPREVKILLLDPDKIYSLDEFPVYKAYSKTHSPPLSGQANSTGKRRYLPDNWQPRPRVLEAGERHRALVHEGARLFQGAAPADIERLRAILKSWYSQSCKPLKPNWEHEVDSFIDDWLLKREFGSFIK